MIFVCLGTQIFQMNRLLVEIDRLVGSGRINEKVFAQIGKSNYLPKYFDFVDFLNPDEYQKKLEEADLIITHGGTGSIVKALKANKKVIGVPRLFKYGEHENDHQLQIVDFFANSGLILKVMEMDELFGAIQALKNNPPQKRFLPDGHIIEIIDNFISENEMKVKHKNE